MQDSSARKAAETNLQEREERLRAIVEEATDYAIFTTDRDGIIESWYPGAEAVFGWSEADAIGQSSDMTFTPEDRANGVPAQERETARVDGRAPDVRWHLRRDGSRVFIDGVSRARYGPDGEFLGAFKIGQDVTDRRLTQQQQQVAEEHMRQDLVRRVDERTAELRALSRRLLLVQEEERRRLALELHDDFGQMLTGLGLILGSGAMDDGRLVEAQRIVAEVTASIRQRSMELRPATLDSHGLLPALRWHLDRYQRQTGIAVELLQEGLDRRFTPPVEVAAYRIVQEALTNVARHAETDRVVVQLFADQEALTVSVRDSGRGFDLPTITMGSGLGGIRERAELLGGTCEIDAKPDGGLALTVELPLEDTVLDDQGRDKETI